MEADIDRILISRDRIAERVREMAAEMGRVYEPDLSGGLTLVAILSGSLIFLADLIRHLPIRMKIGLLTVSSYRGATTEPHRLQMLQELNLDVAGRHVLLVDDILDTGGTLRFVRDQLAKSNPKSMRTCVLLRKPSKAPPDLEADFVGFDIEDAFVVGYGLDYDDHYRNWPDIAVLRKELYASG